MVYRVKIQHTFDGIRTMFDLFYCLKCVIFLLLHLIKIGYNFEWNHIFFGDTYNHISKFFYFAYYSYYYCQIKTLYIYTMFFHYKDRFYQLFFTFFDFLDLLKKKKYQKLKIPDK